MNLRCFANGRVFADISVSGRACTVEVGRSSSVSINGRTAAGVVGLFNVVLSAGFYKGISVVAAGRKSLSANILKLDGQIPDFSKPFIDVFIFAAFKKAWPKSADMSKSWTTIPGFDLSHFLISSS